MTSVLSKCGALCCLIVSVVCLTGCPSSTQDGGTVSPGETPVGAKSEPEAPKVSTPQTPVRVATAKAEDVEAAKAILDGLASNAKYTLSSDGVMTGITIQDGSVLTAENIALFGRLTDLEMLQIYNFRDLNDEMTTQLTGLKNLTTLALTNSVIGDETVELIAKSFPKITDLDLSSNTNLTNGVLRTICDLSDLERLALVQNRFNDLGTSHLSKLANLRVLDLRGNMEAGDMTMEILGDLPKLAALKHRSTTVTDYGVECLARSKTLSGVADAGLRRDRSGGTVDCTT